MIYSVHDLPLFHGVNSTSSLARKGKLRPTGVKTGHNTGGGRLDVGYDHSPRRRSDDHTAFHFLFFLLSFADLFICLFINSFIFLIY